MSASQSRIHTRTTLAVGNSTQYNCIPSFSLEFSWKTQAFPEIDPRAFMPMERSLDKFHFISLVECRLHPVRLHPPPLTGKTQSISSATQPYYITEYGRTRPVQREKCTKWREHSLGAGKSIRGVILVFLCQCQARHWLTQ